MAAGPREATLRKHYVKSSTLRGAEMIHAFVRGVLPKIVTTSIDYADFSLGQSPAPPVKFFFTKSNITVGPPLNAIHSRIGAFPYGWKGVALPSRPRSAKDRL
jgi:hypothetical protein